MSTKQPIWPSGRFGVPQITPFTYRDGHTHLELIESLRDYLVEHLHPSLVSTVNSLVEHMEREYGKALDQYVNGVEEFQRIHDRFMSDVNGALTALNDTAVSDLVDDRDSLLHRILQTVFANQDQLNEHAVNVADFGTTPDSPDSTQGIQDAIDYAHEHGIPRVIVNGTHWIQAHLDGDTGGSPLRRQGGIVLRSNVTLDLRGAVLEAIPNNTRRYNVVRIDDCDNTAILGGHIRGERYEHTDLNGGEWGMGIHITNSTNVTIQDTLITECWGDGMYVAAEPEHHNENVYITGVVCRDNRRQGMSIIGGRNIHTYRSVFTETHGTLPQSGVDIEPNSPETVCENIMFRDCEFTDNATYGLTAMAMDGNIHNVTVDGCTVAGNRSSSANGQLRFVRGGDNITIRDTRVFDGVGPIDVELQTRKAVVEGCDIESRLHLRDYGETEETLFHISNNTLGDSFRVDSGAKVVTLQHNHISTVSSTTTQLYAADDVVMIVEGNMFSPTTHIPLYAYSQNNAQFTVANNVFHGYTEYAVQLRSNGSTSISGNTFVGDSQAVSGVYISTGGQNVTITGNVHTGNGALARFAGDMTDVRMSNNTSDTLFTDTPRGSTAHNVWIERSPVEWWHDGDVLHLGG